MAAGGGGGQQGQSEEYTAIFWVIGAFLITGGVLWVLFKKAIAHFYLQIKLYEINFLSLFTSRLDDVRTAILGIDPGKVTFQEVLALGNAVGSYLRYPLVLVLLILAYVVFFASTTRTFRRIYSMRDLLQLEKVNWPQITPVARLDLVKTDIDKGPWAMAMTPMQFCKRHHLLEEHKKARLEGMTHKEWNQIEVVLKRGEANKVFSIQLGGLWPGLHRVPPHVKALFGAFAARINGDTEAAADLFRRINVSSETKLDFSGAEALCKKYEKTELVQEVLASHAYLLTLMASMLEKSRNDGVQASADFLWLKPIDRKLWYMLNVTGRQTPFVEVAGPFAHWLAEKELGKKLLVPMVEEATNALAIALKEIVYRPDEKA